MNLEELIKSYEEVKSKLKEELDRTKDMSYRQSYANCKNTFETLSHVLIDLKKINGNTVKRELLIDFLKFHYKENPIRRPHKNIIDANDYLSQLND